MCVCVCLNYFTVVSILFSTRITNINATPLTFMNFLIVTILLKMRYCDRNLFKSLKYYYILLHDNFQTLTVDYV